MVIVVPGSIQATVYRHRCVDPNDVQQGEHMSGNVYVKFSDEEEAATALEECERGTHCNFIHVKELRAEGAETVIIIDPAAIHK